MRYCLACHTHRAHEAYIERVLPILVRELHKFPRRRATGVVHNHIESSETLDAIFYETLDVFNFAHIRNRRQNFSACLFADHLGGFLKSLLTTRANADFRAFSSKA